MFNGTGLMALYLDQNQQAVLKNKMGNFGEIGLQKAYARKQGKDYETVTIASISHQIGRKLQAWKNTAPPQGFNIALAKEPSLTSGITQEADKE